MGCPLCADPHGAHLVGMTHTYRPGCSLYAAFLSLVTDARVS